MKRILAFILSIFMILSLSACSFSSPTDSSSKIQNTNASGKDYETLVFNSFWESTCGEFGVNYSDYKWTHTVTSYISDSTTSDGYTAHYYLVKTAFDTKNAFGQKILHEVTARCYYVPDYSKLVYVTYITLDGEKILFNEEKEDWLLGIGGSSSVPSTSSKNEDNSDTTSKEQKDSSTTPENPTTQTESETTEADDYPTEVESEPAETVNTNNIDDLTYIVEGACSKYNSSGDTPLNGQLYVTVNSSTSIEIEHRIGDIIYSDTISVVEKMQDKICELFEETLNDVFPDPVSIEVYSTYSYEDCTKEEAEASDNNGDLDGIGTELTPEEIELLKEASAIWAK